MDNLIESCIKDSAATILQLTQRHRVRIGRRVERCGEGDIEEKGGGHD